MTSMHRAFRESAASRAIVAAALLSAGSLWNACSGVTTDAAGDGNACGAGTVACGGQCVDPLTDEAYCGASGTCTGASAGTRCAAGETCTGGSCAPGGCGAGLVSCAGRCVDPLTDEAYCGASGTCTGASAGTRCAAGETCTGGSCTPGGCGAGLVSCGGRCVDPLTDETYCGASGTCTGASAGTRCAAGETCTGGSCTPGGCGAGLVSCAGRCVDPLTDEAYCGASGTCTGASAGTSCSAGAVCSAGHCVGPGGGEPPELAGITAAHNAVRASVVTATPLPPLTWDPTLAATAAAWAAKCQGNIILDHNPDRSVGSPVYVGENIFATSSSPSGTTAQTAVSWWASESAYYTYETNSCADGAICLHYTQIVWRSTTRLGCAIRTCPPPLLLTQLVCDYAPGGNIYGQKPY